MFQLNKLKPLIILTIFVIIAGHIYRPIPSCPPMKFEETQNSIITSQCTEDCNIYGHSDNCWLPGNKSGKKSF